MAQIRTFWVDQAVRYHKSDTCIPSQIPNTVAGPSRALVLTQKVVLNLLDAVSPLEPLDPPHSALLNTKSKRKRKRPHNEFSIYSMAGPISTHAGPRDYTSVVGRFPDSCR